MLIDRPQRIDGLSGKSQFEQMHNLTVVPPGNFENPEFFLAPKRLKEDIKYDWNKAIAEAKERQCLMGGPEPSSNNQILVGCVFREVFDVYPADRQYWNSDYFHVIMKK